MKRVDHSLNPGSSHTCPQMQGCDKLQRQRLKFESGWSCTGVSSFAHWLADSLPEYFRHTAGKHRPGLQSSPWVTYPNGRQTARTTSSLLRGRLQALPTYASHSDRKSSQIWAQKQRKGQDSHEHWPLALQTGPPPVNLAQQVFPTLTNHLSHSHEEKQRKKWNERGQKCSEFPCPLG